MTSLRQALQQSAQLAGLPGPEPGPLPVSPPNRSQKAREKNRGADSIEGSSSKSSNKRQLYDPVSQCTRRFRFLRAA